MNAIVSRSTLPEPPLPSPSTPDLSRYRITRGDGLEGLTLERTGRRPLAADEIRVRIRAVTLNHRDLMVARGMAGAVGRPIVPASDAAGDVIEVGPAVRGFGIGDPVISTFFPDWLDGPMNDAVTARALGGSMDGVLAQEVVLPASAWVRAPAGLDPVEAATLTCAGVTAWHGLFGLAPIPAGGTVALLGTGGVSIWALQLAKAAGYRVVVSSSHDGKLEQARALGADETVNYRTTPAWGEAIRALSGGHGVDRVLDIGGADTVEQSIIALRTGGTIAIIGRLTGAHPAQFDPAALFGGGKSLAGLMVGSRETTEALARFVERHAIRPVIDRVFPYAKVVEAYQYLARGQHFGKVVVALD